VLFCYRAYSRKLYVAQVQETGEDAMNRRNLCLGHVEHFKRLEDLFILSGRYEGEISKQRNVVFAHFLSSTPSILYTPDLLRNK